MREDVLNISKRKFLAQKLIQHMTVIHNLLINQAISFNNDKHEMNKTKVELLDNDVGLIDAISISGTGKLISGHFKMSPWISFIQV